MRGRVWAIAVGVGVAGAVLIGVIAASTAGNTVPETKAGLGQGTVTGYDVSSVHYTLSPSDPSKVQSVNFTLDSAPVAGSTVSVKLSAAATTWYACTFSGTTVTCPTTSPVATVDQVADLVVVAAQ
ncbi:MAG: hypothetical protein Q8M79_02370 [Dehalococcoidia bacterium]|nr:hypothetical protein [Dehalococcoidia bacterium]